jgi:multimeric flavodoxin WrbA
MGKHYLGISGSPRKDGNTDVAVREALKAISGAGAETRFIRIYDYEIESCLGCRDCMRLGRCVIQDDDVEELLEMLRNSSGAVIGAPVYWDGPPGRMKDFIDRSHGYYASRSGDLLSGLDFCLISVATASGFEPHEDVMLSWIEYYGANLVGSARIYARDKGDLPKRSGELAKARGCGLRLLEAR